jgi:acetyltransferase-like isoleucine patch superfamily enzyme
MIMNTAGVSGEGAAPAHEPQSADQIGVKSLEAYLDLVRKVREAAQARLYFRGCTIGKHVRAEARPFVSRGRGGKIVLGDRVRIVSRITPCELGVAPGALLEIGERTIVNYGTSLGATQLVRIGAQCLLGTYVNVIDNNFHDLYDRGAYPEARPVIIEDDVWLCSRVIVLPGAHIERGVVVGAGSIVQPGVRIGRDAIVAAGTVVHEHVPARSVIMGNPAQIIYALPEPDISVAEVSSGVARPLT